MPVVSDSSDDDMCKDDCLSLDHQVVDGFGVLRLKQRLKSFGHRLLTIHVHS